MQWFQGIDIAYLRWDHKEFSDVEDAFREKRESFWNKYILTQY